MSNNRLPNGPVPFIVPSKEHATGTQVGVLLDIVGTLTARLSEFSVDSPDQPNRGRLDGEVKIALESTVIKALATLDSVVEQAKRWNVQKLIQAEGDAGRLIKANINFLQEQAASAASVRRPSFRFNPRLVRMKDGSFAAILGDDLDTAVVGQGETVEAALEAFDEACRGQLSSKVLEWIKQKQQQTEKENEQQRTLDTGTIEPAAGTPPSGKNSSGNLKRPRRRSLQGDEQNRSNRKRKNEPGADDGASKPA